MMNRFERRRALARRAPVAGTYDCSDFEPDDHPQYRLGTIFQCRACHPQIPVGKSAREYMHLEVGWTQAGLQVWCKRCERDVVHLDFEGRKIKTYEEPESQA